MARSSRRDDAERSALRDALARCRSSFVAVAAFSFFLNVLSFAVPLYLLQIYDRVVPSRSQETLLFLTLIAFAAIITLALLEAMRGLVLAAGSRFRRAGFGFGFGPTGTAAQDQ